MDGSVILRSLIPSNRNAQFVDEESMVNLENENDDTTQRVSGFVFGIPEAVRLDDDASMNVDDLLPEAEAYAIIPRTALDRRR